MVLPMNYMPLSSTIVLKRKKEMLYDPLDFQMTYQWMPLLTQEPMLVQ